MATSFKRKMKSKNRHFWKMDKFSFRWVEFEKCLQMSRRLNKRQQNSSCDRGALLGYCSSHHIISTIHCAIQPPVAVTNYPGLPLEVLLGLSQNRKWFREHVTEQICSICEGQKAREDKEAGVPRYLSRVLSEWPTSSKECLSPTIVSTPL